MVHLEYLHMAQRTQPVRTRVEAGA
jgi:hypothetical protein